jgi:hypothetical protein
MDRRAERRSASGVFTFAMRDIVHGGNSLWSAALPRRCAERLRLSGARPFFILFLVRLRLTIRIARISRDTYGFKQDRLAETSTMDRRGAASLKEMRKVATGPERRSLSAQRGGGAAEAGDLGSRSPQPEECRNSRGRTAFGLGASTVRPDNPKSKIQTRNSYAGSGL